MTDVRLPRLHRRPRPDVEPTPVMRAAADLSTVARHLQAAVDQLTDRPPLNGSHPPNGAQPNE